MRRDGRTGIVLLPLVAAGLLALAGCATRGGPRVTDEGLRFEAGNTVLVLATGGQPRVFLKTARGETPLTTPDGSTGPAMIVDGRPVEYRLDWGSLKQEKEGRWSVQGASPDGAVGVTLTLRVAPSRAPEAGEGVELVVRYENRGAQAIAVQRMHDATFSLDASVGRPDLKPWQYWAFLGGSYEERYDWIVPVTADFFRDDYQGMNAPDYGGGIPAVDLWTPAGGLLLASTSPVWRPVALPVRGLPDGVLASLEERRGFTLAPGAAVESVPVLVLAHEGDAYNGLHAYGRIMEAKGLSFPDPPEDAYEPMWCAWGYERRFHPDEILATLPKVKELGYKWVGVDDGYQLHDGDWDLDGEKFPRGDASMRALVDSIHAYGLKAMLWWVPGDADPESRIVREHPDWVVRDSSGKPAMISWWDTEYLAPTVPGVLEHQRELVDRFLGDWGYDALKTDGQHLNLVPPSFVPSHYDSSPYEVPAHTPEILKAVMDEALKIKPDAILHTCPCGTVFNLYNMPYTNQFVASDPLSSWQIRTKHYVLRAIIGDKIAFYGDHVELSDGGSDFASTVGLGGVPGSKFIWPEPKPVSGDFLLTPEREKLQRHWLEVYEENNLSRAKTLNLYILGFDQPEAYAFGVGDTLYYSFYADHFAGRLDLRGLEPGGRYSVEDYDRDRSYGEVTGPVAGLDVNFEHHLLLRALPRAAH